MKFKIWKINRTFGLNHITFQKMFFFFILLLPVVGSWGYTQLTLQLELITLGCFMMYFMRVGKITIYHDRIVWLTFWIYVLFRCIIAGNLFSGTSIPVFLYICLFLATYQSDSGDYFIKFIKIVGIIEAIGVYYQLLFNASYNILYQSLFTDYAYNWITSRYELYHYLSGFTSEVSKVAGFLGLSLGAFIYDYDINKNRIRKWGEIAFITVAIVMTGKRSQTFFGLLGVIVVYFISATNREKVNRILKILGITIIISIAMFYIYLEYGESNAIGRMIAYIVSIFSGEENTYGGRSGIWQKALSLFGINPVIGIGWNRFTSTVENLFGTTINSAHNVYLQLLCELGIVGFFLFVMAAVHTIFVVIRHLKYCSDAKDRRNYKLLLYLNVFYFTYCFFGNCLNDISYSLIFFPAIVVLHNKKRTVELE